MIGTTVPAHGTVIYRILQDVKAWDDDQPITVVSIGLSGAASVGSHFLAQPGAATPVTTV